MNVKQTGEVDYGPYNYGLGPSKDAVVNVFSTVAGVCATIFFEIMNYNCAVRDQADCAAGIQTHGCSVWVPRAFTGAVFVAPAVGIVVYKMLKSVLSKLDG